MMRNTVLLMATLAVLAAAFWGYVQLTQDDAIDVARREQSVAALPPSVQAASQEAFTRGNITALPGRELEFTRYDPRTGRVTDIIRLQQYSAVPGTTNEVAVTRPELIMLLPNGMTATVTAERGQLVIDRIESSSGRPKRGWLEGEARIAFDRDDDPNRPPLEQRKEDAILVSMNRLEFDLDLGELNTQDRVQVSSEEFHIAGTGLKLVWNRAENRVETMQIERGERAELLMERGLFGEGEPQPAATQVADAAPGIAATQAVAARSGAAAQTQPAAPRPRKRNGYVCTVAGDVRVEQFDRADDPNVPGGSPRWRSEPSSSIETGQIRLTFEVGARADRFVKKRRAESQPATPRKKVVMTWSGPLSLLPFTRAGRDLAPRQQIEAEGGVVRLRLGDGRALDCGKLTYDDASEQLWLYPDASGRLDIQVSANTRARAQSIYYDGSRDVVKLVGDVELRSLPKAGQRSSSIRCALWAELKLAPDRTETPSAERLLSRSRLSQATFVGGVRVRLQDQRLDAGRLVAHFREGAEDESIEALLDRAVAEDGVRLREGEREVSCGWMQLQFERTAEGRLFAREVEGRGMVAARDPQRAFNATGDALTTTFDGPDSPTLVTIRGSSSRTAFVRRPPYALRGPVIEYNPTARTLAAPGRSRLAVRSERSLQGRESGGSQLVRVSAERSLLVDLARNRIEFAGNVIAASADERLYADTLELLLEERVRGSSRPRAKGRRAPVVELVGLVSPGLARVAGAALPAARPVSDVYAVARSNWQGRPESSPARPSGDALARIDEVEREPVRVIASNALITSIVQRPGEALPLIEQSLAAPRIEIAVPERRIWTTGATTLLLADRRLRELDAGAGVAVVDATAPGGNAPAPADGEPRGADALGVPSALVTRGPSQTALQAERSMTYLIGPEGSQRRDTVVFEGGVQFRHVAGREMVNVEQMLPQVRSDPALLDRLPQRNSYLSCDRLEVDFVARPEDGAAARAAGAAPPTAALQLDALRAAGNVYLRDQVRGEISSIEAVELFFEKATGLVRVLGQPGLPAKLMRENKARGSFDAPLSSEEIIVNLNDRSIRTKAATGQTNR